MRASGRRLLTWIAVAILVGFAAGLAARAAHWTDTLESRAAKVLQRIRDAARQRL